MNAPMRWYSGPNASPVIRKRRIDRGFIREGTTHSTLSGRRRSGLMRNRGIEPFGSVSPSDTSAMKSVLRRDRGILVPGATVRR